MPPHTNTALFVMKDGERTVTRDQILQGLEKFDKEKRGKVRDTQGGWFIRENEQRYPPKWLLRLATDLQMTQFKGKEARKTLNLLGFDLKEVDKVDGPNLERNLKSALRANMEQLEAGLKITDNGKEKRVEYGGKKQMVESGRIDITAKDRNGATVVIELKRGKAGRRAVGQILGYMGVLVLTHGTIPIRGVLVAKEFSPQAKAAARVVPDLQLIKYRKYRFKFTFEIVEAG
jgi:hypothetical protein